MTATDCIVIKIRLPIPASALSPNARRLWHKKCGPVRDARLVAKLLAIDAMNRMKLWIPPKWKHAETSTVFYFPTNRRRDEDNYSAIMKHSRDGFADAGVVVNDSGFTHKRPVLLVDKIDPRVEVEIREVPAS